MNPYYDKEFDLEMLSFDQPELCYEFNILCFWATKDGRVYSASDSGCSCPVPFENYCAATVDEVLQMLERVGSVEQAERIGESWGHLSGSEKQQLSDWVKARLKQ